MRENGELHSSLGLSGGMGTYTDSQLDLCLYTGPTCLSTPLFWGKVPGEGKEKHTHMKGAEPAWA